MDTIVKVVLVFYIVLTAILIVLAFFTKNKEMTTEDHLDCRENCTCGECISFGDEQ